MKDLDRLIASSQIALSALFLTGYFVVLILFMLGYAQIPNDFEQAFSGLLSLMTGGGLTILYFWFQRSRAGGIPDSGTTTTTTESVITPGKTADVPHPATASTKVETVTTPTQEKPETTP